MERDKDTEVSEAEAIEMDFTFSCCWLQLQHYLSIVISCIG